MFRPCADTSVFVTRALTPKAIVRLCAWVTVASMLVLSGCGSSPKKDEPKPTPSVQQSKTDNAKSESRVPPKLDEPAQSNQKSSDKPSDKTVVDKKSAKKGDEKSPAELEPAQSAAPPIPPEAAQQFEKALTLLGAGDYAPATKEFQRLSELYPDYSGPLTNLGIVYLKTGKLADAEKTLRLATQRGEPSAAAFNQLGIVYRKLGKFKEADDAYSHAIKIDDAYALAHLNLGVLCDMYLGQPQRALNEMERYMQLTPNPDPRVAGWVKELQGRVGKSKSDAPAAGTAAPATSGATP